MASGYRKEDQHREGEEIEADFHRDDQTPRIATARWSFPKEETPRRGDDRRTNPKGTSPTRATAPGRVKNLPFLPGEEVDVARVVARKVQAFDLRS